ncbi:MAG: hypothetical protein V4594_17685 [Bacteroidota bacterium]
MEAHNLEDLKNQEDVKPSEALEKIIVSDDNEQAPQTTGTGGNSAVPREDSLIIESDSEDS